MPRGWGKWVLLASIAVNLAIIIYDALANITALLITAGLVVGGLASLTPPLIINHTIIIKRPHGVLYWKEHWEDF